MTVGARLLWSVPRYLRQPIRPEEARAILAQRLTARETDFLTLARRAIYQHPGSPYRKLLELAGCQYGDLERLVRADGLEAALRALYRRGVYLTVDEFKGRRPAIRGSTTLDVQPTQLRNPGAAVYVPRYSSGSRGQGTPAPFDLAHLRDRAVDVTVWLEARGGLRWRHAIWGVPGGTSITHLLEYAAAGAPLVRWFSPVDPAAPGLHVRYRWMGRVLQAAGLLAGVAQPGPVHVPLEAPLPIARWMEDVLQAGEVPHLHTTASCAVRLCEAARQAGIDLRGARFTLRSEPLTPVRLAAIRESGAEALPRYASVETGPMAVGCLVSECPDEMHLFTDQFALIQPGHDAALDDLPPAALLVSCLRPTAPLILLNVSLGDQGELGERRCGCPLEELGWTTHLHTVRSYEKLTAEGVTFLDVDVIRVLEEVLPARFGGGPTDYQLVEGEAEDGQPLVRLLVHPAIGPVDPAAVADAFLTGIGGGTEGERLMELHWRRPGLLRVERRAPLTTDSGKILHLHVERRPPPPA